MASIGRRYTPYNCPKMKNVKCWEIKKILRNKEKCREMQRNAMQRGWLVGDWDRFHLFLDRSQSVFYFVPQENRLIRRPLWAWKNLGESIFHWQDGSLRAKNAQIGEETCQLSCGTCQNFFSFTFVAVWVTFLKVTLPLAEKSTKWISLAVVSYLSPPVFPTTIPHHCCIVCHCMEDIGAK